jgi:hypothetical protein
MGLHPFAPVVAPASIQYGADDAVVDVGPADAEVRREVDLSSGFALRLAPSGIALCLQRRHR